MNSLDSLLVSLLMYSKTLQLEENPQFPFRIFDGNTYIEVQKTSTDTYRCEIVDVEKIEDSLFPQEYHITR